tara:strand:- start:59484 stop:61277 length:1794 start_codon:yes stop_codon:yes gene_type:complete
MSEGEDKVLAAGDSTELSRSDRLPDWFPSWAGELAELYFSGTTNVFLLHGNTFDFVRTTAKGTSFGSISDFLSQQLFGRWDLVLHYDLARGLRCVAGSSAERLREMVALANRRVGDLSKIPKDPSKTLMVLDRFLQKNVMAKPQDRLSVGIVIDHASFVVPRGDRISLQEKTHLVTLLNWATSPYLKRLNMCVALLEDQQSNVSERLVGNPHVASIEVSLPKEADRLAYLEAVAGKKIESVSDYTIEEIAKLTAGIALADLNVLVQSALEADERLDSATFQKLKKRLIERQARGLLEFIEPSWGLDMVVGHDAAKERLRQDALLLKKGRLESVPMGYLFCGPVGTGKSFLAQCATGSIGIPCVKLKNFRSKYVGETEGNLERVLGVLRSMGPVVVIVDEADAMLGDRQGSGGDSGVNSRIFGMIAQQMGDTRYRGKILWMLLTARPDLLPIDIKRQGRAEVHVPLFYPTEESELKKLFLVLAKKSGATLREENVPTEIQHKGNLSGADIEGIIGRAWRISLIADSEEITKEALAEALEGFLPSSQSLERELQELAAIIECTDIDFLPAAKLARMKELGGREHVQERLTAVKQIVENR